MKKGFSAVEILILVVVLAVLVGFTIPKFQALVSKAKEGSTKHELRRMRSAIAAYYGENQGVYPTDDLKSLVPQFIEKIPTAHIPGLPPSSQVSVGSYEQAFTNTGGWAYVNDPTDPRFGDVFVNTDKQDSYGVAWDKH